MDKIVKKGGPVTKKRRKEVMDSLTELIENGNIMGVTNQQLANQFKLKRQTISLYLKEVYEKIPTEDILCIEIKLKSLFDKILRFSQKMLANAKTPYEQERALKLILQATREFTDFLERFGLKAKVQENINLNGNLDITQRSINIQVIDDRRDVIKVESE